MSPRRGSQQQAAGSALQRTPRPETRPKQQTCGSCGAQVLEARTTSGLDVVVDAPPLSAPGEVLALLAGLATYTWHLVPDHLVHRYPLVCQHRPAGTVPRQTVHPRHRCGNTWPALDPHPPSAETPPGCETPPPY